MKPISQYHFLAFWSLWTIKGWSQFLFVYFFLKFIRNVSTYFTTIATESIWLLTNLLRKISGFVNDWSICRNYPQARILMPGLQKECSVVCLIARKFFSLVYNDTLQKGLLYLLKSWNNKTLFKLPKWSLKWATNFTEMFNPRVWLKSLTNENDPRVWLTTMTHEFDQR